MTFYPNFLDLRASVPKAEKLANECVFQENLKPLDSHFVRRVSEEKSLYVQVLFLSFSYDRQRILYTVTELDIK